MRADYSPIALTCQSHDLKSRKAEKQKSRKAEVI